MNIPMILIRLYVNHSLYFNVTLNVKSIDEGCLDEKGEITNQ